MSAGAPDGERRRAEDVPPAPSGRERESGVSPGESSVLTPDVDALASAVPVEPGAPFPDLGVSRAAILRPETRSVGVTVLAVLAVLYTLHVARDFLLPVAFALLLDFFFSPVVRGMARWRVRPPLGAAVVVLGLVGLVTLLVYELAGPVQSWAARAPETAAEAREKLADVIGPLQRMSETAARVQEATGVGGDDEGQVVVQQGPSLFSRIFGTTQRLVTDVVQMLVLLYFLLAAGDLFLQKLVKVLPRVGDKQAAVQVARKIEASISTYLLTAAAVNLGEAIVVTIAMYLLGMPNPLLWGALVLLLEFIPYIGAAIMTLVLAVAALTTYDTVGQALLVPAVFVLINLVQGNFVSPLLHADRLTLNPVAVFVGLSFWWYVWGIPGAFIAVPLLAAFKILCDHVAPLASIGEFLGQRDVRERRAIIRGQEEEHRHG